MRKTVCLLLAVLILACFPVPVFASDAAQSPEPRGILSGVADVYQVVKNIFVPKEDYFHNRLGQLNNKVNEHFAGLGHLYLMLNEFFQKLDKPGDADLKVSFPDDFWYPGYKGFSVDVLSAAKPYVSFLRAALGGGCCLMTAIACYHKIRAFFRE